MQPRKRICIDFDGVLAKYRGVWKGEKHCGKPLPGVKQFLEKLAKADIDVIVLTSRDTRASIHKWFKAHDLPLPKEITNKKVKATAYIDDRAVHFDGNFKHLSDQLAKFKVYWTKERPFREL
jgi:ribonucleotide monophosphatase NagD (HAD superfamily)